MAACSDDESEPTTTTTTTTAQSSTAPSSDDGPPPTTPEESVAAFVLEATALPEGFAPSPDVDDAITTFCAGEDATAGLSASAREAVGFRREPPGASVIQLVYRFDDDDAAAFVAHAATILDRCSGVPDHTGLAFEYEPVTPTVDETLAGTDAHAARYGASVGSGNLTTDLAVFHHGDVGQLVAVLGVELPRADLDALATAVFAAAAAGQ